MTAVQTLRRMIDASAYHAYIYSYPHKTAHRPIADPVPLRDLWRDERREALFLYLHIPFCEKRCGYCNLLSSTRPDSERIEAFVDTLERQARVVRAELDALGDVSFARFAVGGGTPTVLSVAQLERLMAISERMLGVGVAELPSSVEVSPQTATSDRLALLAAHAVERISIGIQTFVDSEARALSRVQTRDQVDAAIERIRQHGFPTLNIDLIYGIDGQTNESWKESIEATLKWAPEEIYLYPLYVRALTPLSRRPRSSEDRRLELYGVGRNALVAAGYEQLSMRMFRKNTQRGEQRQEIAYSCQQDGMIGLACGARSYTERLHYSTEYAVGQPSVREIIDSYIGRDTDAFRAADHGVVIDEEDRRRRHVILSLLQRQGLDLAAYRTRFGSDPLDDLPQLAALRTLELATLCGDRLALTEKGLSLSDTIGPWLQSERITQLMAQHEVR